jgi:tetratricopeptide (TPR) repeat protein
MNSLVQSVPLRLPGSLVNLFVLAILSPNTPAMAQKHVLPPEQVAAIRQGLDHVYRLNYDQAIKTYEQMIAADPKDPAGYAYLAMVHWARELGRKQELGISRFAASDFFSESSSYRISIDPQAEARFNEASDRAIEYARARLRANSGDKAALFILGLVFQNMATFDATLKRSWWSAFRNGSHTYRYHRELLQLEPGFTDAMLSLGVFNYVAGSLPWSIKWVGLLMGYRGSKTRGKEQLWTAANHGILAADAARISLALIYTRERQFQPAFDILSGMHKRFPENYLLQLDMGGLQLSMGRPERALEIYEAVLKRRQAKLGKYAEIELGLLYNRLGVAHRAQRNFPAATDSFNRALSSGPANASSSTVARLELGKTLDLMNRRSEALSYYRQVAEAEDYAGSRNEARRLLAEPFRR